MNLHDLIQWRKAELRMSWRELAARAEQAGHTISAARLSELGNNRPPLTDLPEVGKLHAISAAIGVDVAQVFIAAGNSVKVLDGSDPTHEFGGLERVTAVLRGATDRQLDLIAQAAELIRKAGDTAEAEPAGTHLAARLEGLIDGSDTADDGTGDDAPDSAVIVEALERASHLQILAELARRIQFAHDSDRELPPVPQVHLQWPMQVADSKSSDSDLNASDQANITEHAP